MPFFSSLSIESFAHPWNPPLIPWKFFQSGGASLHDTGQMARRINPLIHRWNEFPWMINFHGWGATSPEDHYYYGKLLSGTPNCAEITER